MKLSEVSEIVIGKTPNQKKPEFYENAELPLITRDDFGNKYINECQIKVSKNAQQCNNLTEIPKGSIVLVLFGEAAGELAITEIDSFVGQTIMAIIPSTHIDPYFLYHYLSNNLHDFCVYQKNTDFIQVAIRNLKEISLPNIDFVKQKNIADQLVAIENNTKDKLDIIKKEQVELKERLHRELNDVFNKKLESWSEIEFINVLNRIYPIDYYQDEYIFDSLLSTDELIVDFNTPYRPKIKTNKFRSYGSDLFKIMNDEYILLYTNGSDLGKAIIVPDYYSPAACKMEQASLNPNKKVVNRDFLYYLISSDYFQRLLMSKKNINKQCVDHDDILKIKIFIPELFEQEVLASKLKKIELLTIKALENNDKRLKLIYGYNNKKTKMVFNELCFS